LEKNTPSGPSRPTLDSQAIEQSGGLTKRWTRVNSERKNCSRKKSSKAKKKKKQAKGQLVITGRASKRYGEKKGSAEEREHSN